MSAVTNVANVISKKRRKSESKPQSQINKCLNEKRRREQENVHFEELAELISASISDMNSLSVKPDKCAILQATVNQIRKIKEQESEHCDAIQQSDVSSSKPSILNDVLLGPLLLETLDGFVILVSTEGKIELVSENVTSFIKYTRDDLIGESIYNIIHLGDQARFNSALLPVTLGLVSDNNSQNKGRTFDCRLLVKSPVRPGETMEESQQRVSHYENMQISAAFFPRPGDREENSEIETTDVHMVCVARRIPANEKNSVSAVEQFSTKLDVSGKITIVDTSGVSSTYSQYLNKDLVGRSVLKLCHPADQQKLTQHLKEALQTGSCTSGIYRFRLAQEKYIRVQTKSTTFSHGNLNREPEFIMSIHSIIGDNEVGGSTESNGSSSGGVSPSSGLGASSSSMATTSVAPSSSPLVSTAGLPGRGGSGIDGNEPPAPSSSAAQNPNGTNSSGNGSNSGTGGNGGTSVNNFTVPPDLDFSLDMFQNTGWEVGCSESGLDSSQEVNFSNSSIVVSAASHTLSSMATVSWSNGRPISRLSTSVATSSGAPMAGSMGFESAGSLSPGNVISSRRTSATPPTAFHNSFQFSPIPEPSSVSGSDRVASSPTHAGRAGKATNFDADKKTLLDDGVASSSSPITAAGPGESAAGGSADSQAVKLRQLLTQGDEDIKPSSAILSLALGDDGKATHGAGDAGGASAAGDASQTTLESGKDVPKGENTILIELLNQQDEDFDEMDTDIRRPIEEDKGCGVPSSTHNSNVACGEHQEVPKKPNPSNNVLLRTLLNEKSDDDCDSDRLQAKRPNEYLHQLLDMQQEFEESANENPVDESILRQLVCNPPQRNFRDVRQPREFQRLQQQSQQHDFEGFTNSLKRKTSMDHEPDSMGEASMPTKHPNLAIPGSSVVYNNKMLLDLLNKEPKKDPAPASVDTSKLVTQRPQDKLPKDLRVRIMHTPVQMDASAHQRLQQQHQQQQHQQQAHQHHQQQTPTQQSHPPHRGLSMNHELISPDGSHMGMQMSGGRVAISTTVHAIPTPGPGAIGQQRGTSGYLSDLLNQPLRHDAGQMPQVKQQHHPSVMQGCSGGGVVPSVATSTTTMAPSSVPSPMTRPSHPNMLEAPNSSMNEAMSANTRYPQQPSGHSLMVDYVTDSPATPMPSTSQEHSDIISDIVQHVMDLQNEMESTLPGSSDPSLMSILNEIGPSSTNVSSSITSQDEKMAINAIQKQLMSCENQNMPLSPSLAVPQQLPPYSSAQMPPSPNVSLQSYSNHPPPPVYQQQQQGLTSLPPPSQSSAPPGSFTQRMRFTGQNAMPSQMMLNMQRSGGGVPQYAPNVSLPGMGPQQNVRQPLVLQQRRPVKHSLQQQQQQQQQQQNQALPQRRMLSSQQQHQLLQEQLSPSSYDNMADLLNSPAAPNVTLQRSSNSNMPDSQLSPGYGGNLIVGGQQQQQQQQALTQTSSGSSSQQISPGVRMSSQLQAPYSPHAQMASPLPFPAPHGATYSPQQGQQQQARLSPHPQANMPSYSQQQQQQQSAHSQLSPRITTPHPQQQPQQQPFPSPQLSPQPQPGNASGAPSNQSAWAQAARNNPNLQQNNPMLNAQLSQFLAMTPDVDHGNLPVPHPPQQQQSAYSSQVRFSQPPPRQQHPQGGGVRSMPSPGTPGSIAHQNPFPDQQHFAQANLPTGQPNPQVALYQQQQQQVRMQRAVSVPGQMPGRVLSPRASHFVGSSDPLLSPGQQMSPSFPTSGLSQSYSMATSVPQSAPPPSYSTSSLGNPHNERTHFPFDDQSLHVFGGNAGSQMDRGAGMSAYVRRELRNHVGARTQQQQGQGQQQQLMAQNMGGPGAPSNSSMLQSEFDSLAHQLDLPTGDGQSKSPGLFNQPMLAMAGSSDGDGNNGGRQAPNQQHNSRIHEEQRPNEKSLLQKLLSEPS